MDERRKEACERGAEMSEELWEKASELQKHQNKERELQNELRMLSEERKRTENETLLPTPWSFPRVPRQWSRPGGGHTQPGRAPAAWPNY